MKKFTKITSSIGPNCGSKEMLEKMIEAGVNVCRLNFSHDGGDVQGAKIDAVREIAARTGNPVAILADLQGPKHRIGNFETEDKFPIKPGLEPPSVAGYGCYPFFKGWRPHFVK